MCLGLGDQWKGRPTPHGVGGLKCPRPEPRSADWPSHPTRGGWIEMFLLMALRYTVLVPPLTGWVD